MFMKLQGIVIPHREEDFTPIDTLFAVILPLIVVYGNISKANKYTETLETNGNGDPFDVFIFKKLLALADPKYIGISNGRNLITTSPVLPYTLELLNQYDSKLAMKLKAFRPSDRGYRYTTFDSFINESLIRGLSSLFSIDTLVFVWDQGFVTNFNIMLPLVLVACLLDSVAEYESLTALESVIDSFNAHCHALQTKDLRKILTKHCSDELQKHFHPTATYDLAVDEGVLQAHYSRIFP